ncbi:CoA-binding protein [Candidatus Magnetomoraceae bacterium gMMP-13]
MKKTKPIERVKTDKKKTLTEAESKLLLKKYGIPVISEVVAHDEKEVAFLAESIGFPVVLKGLGAKLTHKTERGLVLMGLSNADEVKKAAKDIAVKAGDELEGFLVQPQLSGKRELVAGLFHDPDFGPVIMFGVGGILTEALNDVVFRLAPLKEKDAIEMIEGIHSKAMLGNYRGEKEINREELLKTLIGLSKLAMEEEVIEVDINPLIVSSDGSIKAVDALVVTGKNYDKKEFPPPVDIERLGALFYPKSIAFIGASATFGKWGHFLLVNTISSGFKGKIYPVNPKGGKISGKPAYTSVEDIPDIVDLAVVTIPAAHILDLIPGLKKKGIKGVLLITSGFKETGQQGLELEEELTKKARQADILILGPNTMGISNPHINFICTAVHVHPLPGSTVIVSHSGNMGTQLLAFAEQQGIGIRAFSGSGNEAMTTMADYIEAFEKDKLTRIVMLYIESVKNSRRFFESAKRLSGKKPIIILKGGRTEAGGKAAATHTGAMASNSKIFDAACRQAGIIQVKHPGDLLDLAAVFSSLPMPKGRRVAIMTFGGGWGVVTSDLCAENGLEVPRLSNKIIERLNKVLPPYWSCSNPVDLVGEHDPNLPIIGMEELIKWEGCDAVINLGIHGKRLLTERTVHSTIIADPDCSQEFMQAINKQENEFEKKYINHIINLMEIYKKPVIGVSMLTDSDKTLFRVQGSRYKGVFFPSPERAVKALSKMCEYQSFIRS